MSAGHSVDLHPTHTCFDDALTNLIFIMKRYGTKPVRTGEVIIVHAIIAPDGEDIGHAWIETPTSVFFTSIMKGERVLVEANKIEYLARSNWKYVRKYTLFEAYAEELRSGHYGPWDAKIRELCPDIRSSSTKKEGSASLEK